MQPWHRTFFNTRHRFDSRYACRRCNANTNAHAHAPPRSGRTAAPRDGHAWIVDRRSWTPYLRVRRDSFPRSFSRRGRVRLCQWLRIVHLKKHTTGAGKRSTRGSVVQLQHTGGFARGVKPTSWVKINPIDSLYIRKCVSRLGAASAHERVVVGCTTGSDTTAARQAVTFPLSPTTHPFLCHRSTHAIRVLSLRNLFLERSLLRRNRTRKLHGIGAHGLPFVHPLDVPSTSCNHTP